MKRLKGKCQAACLIKNGGAVIFMLLAAVMLFQKPDAVNAADSSCKTLCQAVLDAVGNEDKIKYQSSNAYDFGGFTIDESEKVSSIMYLYDADEVYSICAVKASDKSDASDLFKALKTYRSNRKSSDYLSDYSLDEQNVFKNAVCGKKGKFVWYIAMSKEKSVNKKGQNALKKSI